MKISAIILAAGSSSRMGQSKQLLKIGEQTLLEKAICAAGSKDIAGVTVVLGANHASHEEILMDIPVNIVINAAWEKGMGNSLKAGVNHVLQYEHPDAIVVLVCDQPLLSSVHVQAIINAHKETGKPVVASFYSGAPGVPALFHKQIFPDLLLLSDDHGAKKVIQQHSASTTLVEFPGGTIDLDTPEDYNSFLESNNP